MSKLFERLIRARGVTSEFLRPKYDDLEEPYLLPDMELAVERICKAVERREKVLIYGDYDVDGITASVVMEETLRLIGVENIEVMLPDRFADGYGMSPKVITRALKQGVELVITVDCGSANKNIVQKLKEEKVDVIITDHHECSRDLPEAVAVVNPKRREYQGFREIAGVGVAFQVARGLVERGLLPKGQEKWLLDLVLMGTICDNMPLNRDNRIFGVFGLKVLEKTRRVGLLELARIAKVKTWDAEAIGFQIGPRLNAAGRLESAELSLELLRTQSQAEAVRLAVKLEELNQKRRVEQKMAVSEIKNRSKEDNPVIIETGRWHEGILGIVAGRLVEMYKKPAFVLSEVAEGVFKGSGRSFGDFSLIEAIDCCRDILISGGGHKGACGVRIAKDKIVEFKERVNSFYKSLKLDSQEGFLNRQVDIEVENLADFSLEFLDEMRQLQPFGEGNEEPVFKLVKVEVAEMRWMGTEQQHLMLRVVGRDGSMMKLVAFFAKDKWQVMENTQVDVLVQVMKNEWNGLSSVEGRILEIYNMV